MEKFVSRKLFVAVAAFVVLIGASAFNLPLDEKSKSDLMLLVLGYLGAQGAVDVVSAFKQEPPAPTKDPTVAAIDAAHYLVEDILDNLHNYPDKKQIWSTEIAKFDTDHPTFGFLIPANVRESVK